MDDLARRDHPRANREPAEIERKLSLLRTKRIRPLTEYVERLRAAHPGAAVPYFDPTEAGTEARILFLLEAPGPGAVLGRGSGFVSADNNDQTAANMWQLYKEAGIDRHSDMAAWNVVPWYLGDGTQIRAPTRADWQEAAEATSELISVLPKLEVVVLLGKSAAKAWRELGLNLPAIEAPHPSPMSVNTRPGVRSQILEALRRAKQLISNAV